MSTVDSTGDRISGRIEVGGDLSGQVAIGKRIDQRQVVGREPPTAAELAALDDRFRDLERTVAEAAPPEQRDRALDMVAELETAVTAEEPDLTTMEYVRNWFARHLPTAAGVVTSVIVNPVVGKLVAAGGDALVAEFERRFR
jgi:hypothetical protein